MQLPQEIITRLGAEGVVVPPEQDVGERKADLVKKMSMNPVRVINSSVIWFCSHEVDFDAFLSFI